MRPQNDWSPARGYLGLEDWQGPGLILDCFGGSQYRWGDR